MPYNFSKFNIATKATEDWLKKEFDGIRTSRAAPAILDGIFVESYGTKMPVRQVANILAEDPRTLRISPWDNNMIKPIEKAIVTAGLGLSVSVDDKGVRVSFPELTQERRDSLIKLAKEKLEQARVALRKERDSAIKDIEAKEKEGGMGEDEKKRLKVELQKLVDSANKKLAEMEERKGKEILS